jgi:predicted DNA-binding transcriptional regulator AlpA
MALNDDSQSARDTGVGAATCISSHSRYALSEVHSGNVYFDFGAAMSELLRTAEISDQTGIPVATLRWWRHRGEGPRSFKLGKTVFYDADDVAAWVESEKVKTAKAGVN